MAEDGIGDGLGECLGNNYIGLAVFVMIFFS